MATSTTKQTLPKEIFDVEVKNHELLKLAYDAYLANNRTGAARTKTRGEISGGGKKPWRQKGTGRARFGSTRNPIWRGGGIVFGPRGNENYAKKISTRAKRQAVRQALTLADKAGKVTLIDTFACPEGRVKETFALLDRYSIKLEGRILIVVSDKDDKVIRATGNLPTVKAVSATYLNVFDILNADSILISQNSLPIIEAWLVETKTGETA